MLPSQSALSVANIMVYPLCAVKARKVLGRQCTGVLRKAKDSAKKASGSLFAPLVHNV